MAKPISSSFVFLFLCCSALLPANGATQWVEEEKEDEVDVLQSRQTSPTSDCDMSVGEWVYDRSYPLYNAGCSYLSTEFACQRNGRRDVDYQKWKWKPRHCSTPRSAGHPEFLRSMFDALDFLGKMRGKRMMLVGDSIMRNQWESLVCLVEGVIPPERKTLSSNGSTTYFHALDFEASIQFQWAPLLVELEVVEQKQRILHLDSIEENAKYWRGVDVLVFDSAHWWTHSGKWSSWDLYKEGERFFADLNPMVAYEKGLTTWAKWVDLNLDPQRTRVVFRSLSPRHNRRNGWQCFRQREPRVFFDYSYYAPRSPAQLVVLQEVLKRMSFPVYLQDISRMTALRGDGHPSIFTGEPLDAAAAHFTPDCSHWCLPGVPDIWNEMLYALLF